MNLQHLKYAVEVERTGSITEAAENLFISQPSLSKAIREMEAGLGFPVFERTGRGVLPTRKGRALLDHAYAILRQMSEIEALSAGEGAERQALSLCAPRAGYVAEAAVRCCAGLDGKKALNVRLKEAPAAWTVDAVADGRFRLGVIRYPQREEAARTEALRKRGLKCEIVWRFEPVVLVGAGGSLKRAGAQELLSAVEIRCEEGISAGGDGPARVVTVSDRAMLPELLNRVDGAFAWASPLPPALLSRWGLRQLAADPAPALVCDQLIYAAEGKFSPGERAFLDILFEVRNEAVFDRE